MNSKKYKYLILVALCMVGFISLFCQYQMQPMANEIKSSMNLTDSQYSALFTAPMAPAIFISLICGIIVDKLGGRWPMFLSLVLGTLGLWGRVFATSYGMLYLCIFVVGFAATFGNSSNAKMLGGWFSPEETSVCIGVYMAFGALATAAATATTPRMPSLKAAYIVSAVIITFVTVFWFLFYRDKRVEGHRVEDSKCEQESLFTTIKIVLRQRDILMAGVADMLMYGGLQSLSVFLGIILIEKGMSQSQAGETSAFVAIGMFVGNLLIPSIVRKSGELRRTLLCFGVVGGILTILVAFIQNGLLLKIILLCGGLLIGGCVPVLMSIPLRLKTIGVQRTGTAGGLIATFQLFGAVVIPTYVISKIAEGNYVLFVILCGCFSIVGAILIGFLSRNTEVDKI